MLQKFTPLILLLSIVFSSCAKIGYIGKSYTATDKIDVYVSEQAIRQPYEYMGKGYLEYRSGFVGTNKIQKLAEELGRKKGADAVLITDYLSPALGGTTITTTNKTDSVANGVLHTGTTVISPSVQNNFNIVFIKYSK